MYILSDQKSAHVPQAARALGFAGVLPFAALAVAYAWSGSGLQEPALAGFIAYSALILSFLGGIRWGVASRSKARQATALAISVLPSLWAFACLAWPREAASVWGLMFGFLALGWLDTFIPPVGAAAWMRRLRAELTIAVVLCHALLIAAMIMA